MEIKDSIFYVGISFFIVLYGSMIVSFVIKKIQDYRNPGIIKTKEFRKWERNRKIKNTVLWAILILSFSPSLVVYIILNQQGVPENINTLVMMALVVATGFLDTRWLSHNSQRQQ